MSAGCPGLLDVFAPTQDPGTQPLKTEEGSEYCGRGRELVKIIRLLNDGRSEQPILISGKAGVGKTSLLKGAVVHWLSLLPETGGLGLDSIIYTVVSGKECLGSPEAFFRACFREQLSRKESALGRIRSSSLTFGDGLSSVARSVVEDCPGVNRLIIGIDDFDVLLRDAKTSVKHDILTFLFEGEFGAPVKIIATIDAGCLAECGKVDVLRKAMNEGSFLMIPEPTSHDLKRLIQQPPKWIERRPVFELSENQRDAVLNNIKGKDAALVWLGLIFSDLAHARASRVGKESDYVGSVSGLDDPFELRMEFLRGVLEIPVRPVLARIFEKLIMIDDQGGVRSMPCCMSAWDGDQVVRTAITILAEDRIGLLELSNDADPLVSLAGDGLTLAWPGLIEWLALRDKGLHFAETLKYSAERWGAANCSGSLRWRDELLTGVRSVLEETGLLGELEGDPLVSDYLTPEADYLLAEVECSHTGPSRREAIGLRLAELNDDRDGIGLSEDVPRCAWETIPGGRVVVDGREELEVQPFLMAVFPVTRLQFCKFVEAEDGFSSMKWWSGLEKGPVDSLWMEPPVNYPVTRVSWFDAVAFCRWLSAKCGFEVRLPDEWEWQWAAQSARSDFVYPWGSDWSEGCANTDESGIGRATAVGLYPSGQSLQRVQDLAGNTWEWCRNSFLEHSRPGPVSVGSRVIKGGSWRVNRGFARADFRLDALAEDRFSGISFRVVRSLDGSANDLV